MEAASLSQSIVPHPAVDHRRAMVSLSLALLAGGTLRVWMLHKFFEVNGDTRLYGGIAQNLLQQGRYAISDGSGVLHTTLIRLPGYPLFLAACFKLFGMGNYVAVSWIQIGLDLLTCVLLALFAYRISPAARKTPAGHATLWLAALCPFTAIYAVAPLTEGPTLFTIAVALWALARFRDELHWNSALIFTLAVAYAALLRPDGALVGAALTPPMFLILFRRRDSLRGGRSLLPGWNYRLRVALVCTCVGLAPFAAWTWRNWQVLHVFEPLAPRYATDPGEDIWPGWQRWMKTWCLDFGSTYDVYWNVPGAPLNLYELPKRAFDSPAQYAQTAAIASDYEKNGEDLSTELDRRFGRLAQERIAARPLRYYLFLPLGRVADMWLRPRVENLPIDLDWWAYARHKKETRFAWAYAGLNAFFLLLAILGLWMRPRFWFWMAAYMVLRSALLATIEAPEARYTLECFPMLFALGGIALSRMLPSAKLSLLSDVLRVLVRREGEGILGKRLV